MLLTQHGPLRQLGWAVLGLLPLLGLKAAVLPLLGPTPDARLTLLLVDAAVRLLLLGYVLWLVGRLRLHSWLLRLRRFHVGNLLGLAAPFLLLALLLPDSFAALRAAPPLLRGLYLLDNLLIGAGEELFCRGVLLGLLLRAWPGRYLQAAVVSALLFALLHYTNLLRGQPLAVTHGQVLMAFFLGLFLTGLFMRTQNILPPIAFHALFDVAFGTAVLSAQSPAGPPPAATSQGLLPTLVVAAALLGISYRMIRRSHKAAFQRGLADSPLELAR